MKPCQELVTAKFRRSARLRFGMVNPSYFTHAATPDWFTVTQLQCVK